MHFYHQILSSYKRKTCRRVFTPVFLAELDMLVNYVYTGRVTGIFHDIFKRYQKYSDDVGVNLIASSEPIDNADLYHYHRPNKCVEFRKNFVITQHFDIDDPYQRIDKADYIKKLKACKQIICLNDRDYQRFCSLGFSCTLIEHGIDSDLEWEKTKNQNNLVNIGVVAKRYRDGRKGELYLLKLARRLDRKRFGFVFFGSGWFNVVWKLRLIGFRVKYFENQSYFKLPEIYRDINILYIGSIYEAGPANLQEAVESGTFLLAHPVGAVPDYFEMQQSGQILSFDYNNDIKSIELLYSLVISKQSPSFRKETITWRRNFMKHVHLYNRLINGKS